MVTFNPTDIKRVFDVYQRYLHDHRLALDALNVFPNSDGNTGSNLVETVDSIVDSLGEADVMADVGTALGRSSLMGAVGHSGGILAQMLDGFTEALDSSPVLDAASFAAGLSAASRAGYGAVDDPVEGTMLTVMREAAEEISSTADGSDLDAVTGAALRRGVAALRNSENAVDVLEQAGVVDAGGAGVVLLLGAFHEVASGNPPPLPLELFNAVPRPVGTDSDARAPRYEVMFFLEAADEAIPAFRRQWARIGESIVVVGGERLWNCHIHTASIGQAIEAAIEVGRPRGIRVIDLRERVGLLEADVAFGGFSPLPMVQDASIGVVSVAAGSGLVEKFRRMGVQQVVVADGEVPTTSADLLRAVEAAPAKNVVILPNHKSLVPVAEEVDALTTKNVAVVPTRSPIQGLAAMAGYFPGSSDLGELLEDMAAAAGVVDFGEVVEAMRDARVDGWEINKGDWLGVADGRVVVVDPDRFATLRGLVAAILPPTAVAVTIYRGEGATVSDTKALEAWISETHPSTEVTSADGGQPSRPYLVSVE